MLLINNSPNIDAFTVHEVSDGQPTDAKKGRQRFKRAKGQKRIFDPKALLAVCFAFIAFIIIVIICIQKGKNLNTYRTENVSLYTWFNSEKIEYENSKLVFDRTNSATELKIDDESQSQLVESTPFFYKDERKVLFPQEMDIVQPRANNGQQDRLPSLSFIDGTSTDPQVTFADVKKVMGSTFLFDGNDLYFFINPVTIHANNQDYPLPEFSFATYNYNHELYLYAYGNDNPIYLEDVDSVLAESDNGYKIDLATDTFEYNGKSRLLVKNINRLEALK